jgi:hypothetical protein
MTGGQELKERACQSAMVLLQRCRSSKHNDINYSGIVAPMTKLICGGVYNIKSYIMIKGFDDLRAGSLGTRAVTGGSTAVQKGQQHVAGKLCQNSIKTEYRHIFRCKEHGNNMGR